MSLQEQLELPEVPTEPLPEMIPGMFSLHSFGFWCSCPLQGSESLSQCKCPGKWERTAAAGVGTGPAEPSLQQHPRLCSLSVGIWSLPWGADVTPAVLVTSCTCSGAVSCLETPHSMERLHEEFLPCLSQARLPPTAPGRSRHHCEVFCGCWIHPAQHWISLRLGMTWSSSHLTSQ